MNDYEKHEINSDDPEAIKKLTKEWIFALFADENTVENMKQINKNFKKSEWGNLTIDNEKGEIKMAKKTGWISINCDFYRNNINQKGSKKTIINTNNTSFLNVKKEVKKWVKTWTGKGFIVINYVETSFYSDYELTDKQEDFFRFKVYKFNN